MQLQLPLLPNNIAAATITAARGFQRRPWSGDDDGNDGHDACSTYTTRTFEPVTA